MYPAVVAIEYLKERQFQGIIYVIGSTAINDSLKMAGFETIHGVNS